MSGRRDDAEFGRSRIPVGYSVIVTYWLPGAPGASVREFGAEQSFDKDRFLRSVQSRGGTFSQRIRRL